MSSTNVLERGLQTVKEDGIAQAVDKAISYFTPSQVTNIQDYLIRRWLNEPYGLPKRARRHFRYHDYARQGMKIPVRVAVDTTVPINEDTRIVDVGCGDGAFSQEIARIDTAIDYTGLDVNKKYIDTLNDKFEETNFEFKHTDIQNEFYNPDGTIAPDEIELPLADSSTDLIVMNSVVNHIGAECVQSYFGEFARILDTGGEVWLGLNIMQDESDRYIKSDYEYEYDHGGFYSDSENVGKDTLYSEELLRYLCRQAGLSIHSRHYGNWRYAEKGNRVKDAMVLSNDDTASGTHG
jgi:SAM-dependent methyltransferase